MLRIDTTRYTGGKKRALKKNDTKGEPVTKKRRKAPKEIVILVSESDSDDDMVSESDSDDDEKEETKDPDIGKIKRLLFHGETTFQSHML